MGGIGECFFVGDVMLICVVVCLIDGMFGYSWVLGCDK